MIKLSILDGYTDEPTCLGVPPYISPYPRYIAGAIRTHNKSIHICYITIDQLRKNKQYLDLLIKSDFIIVICGISVPGRYLSGFPISPKELIYFLENLEKPIKILCGPAAKYGFSNYGREKTRYNNIIQNIFDIIICGDEEIVISEIVKNDLEFRNIDVYQKRKNSKEIRDFAIKGAKIVKKHPFFPEHLITEIETYRGCTRSITGGCSFCSESIRGLPDYRPIKDIIDEIQALYKIGVKHFRLGNQPCIFSYMAKDSGKVEFPKPNINAIEKLFKGIRFIAPNLETLHIDNANPGILARYPNECKKVAKTIIKYHTSGDVAAFGVESIDPVVFEKNNLKANSEEIFDAITLLNKIGSTRGKNGMPELLPGLNFVLGLKGETKKSYELNYEFLENILNNDLLIRRINLRQIIPIKGTKMYHVGDKIISKHKYEFQKFKNRVRENIERPMLKKILPYGTIMRNVYTEKYDGNLTFSRQMGSYPLLVGIPGIIPLNVYLDVKIVDYGYRSVTAVPFPLNINTANRETIEALPGIGKKRALRIMVKRPFNNKNQFIHSFDDLNIGKELLKYINFK